MNQTKSILTLSLPIRPSSHFILRSWIKVHKTFHYTLNSFIYFLLNFWSDLCYCCSVTQSSPILCDPMDRSMPGSPSLTVSQSLPKFMSIASVMPSSHLIFWCPLLLLPSIFLSIRDFSNELAVHIRWPKYWSFRFGISPSKEYSDLYYFNQKYTELWGHFLCVSKPMI